MSVLILIALLAGSATLVFAAAARIQSRPRTVRFVFPTEVGAGRHRA